MCNYGMFQNLDRDRIPLRIVAAVLSLPKDYHPHFLRFIDEVYPLDEATWPETLLALFRHLSVKKIRRVPPERFARLLETLGEDTRLDVRTENSIAAATLAAIRQTPETYHTTFLELLLAMRPLEDLTPDWMIGYLVLRSQDDMLRVLHPEHIRALGGYFHLGEQADPALLRFFKTKATDMGYQVFDALTDEVKALSNQNQAPSRDSPAPSPSRRARPRHPA